jgi:hypothetical protein
MIEHVIIAVFFEIETEVRGGIRDCLGFKV